MLHLLASWTVRGLPAGAGAAARGRPERNILSVAEGDGLPVVPRRKEYGPARKVSRLHWSLKNRLQNGDCRHRMQERGGADGTWRAPKIHLVDSLSARPARTEGVAAARS